MEENLPLMLVELQQISTILHKPRFGCILKFEQFLPCSLFQYQFERFYSSLFKINFNFNVHCSENINIGESTQNIKAVFCAYPQLENNCLFYSMVDIEKREVGSNYSFTFGYK